MDNGLIVIAIVALVVLTIVVVSCVKICKQGYNHVIEKLGKYDKTATPGLYFIVPVYQSIRAKVSVMETVLNVPEQSVITRDNAVVLADGVVFFQVLNPTKSIYQVANIQHALLNLTMTNIRTVMGSMDLDELLSKREEINARIMNAVDKVTDEWGVKVTRIELLNIEPPRDMVDAMSRQLKAERERRSAILEAEGEKQSAILTAEGKLEAAKLEANARERLAEAEANATRSVSEAITEGNTQALNYFLGVKYVEAMAELATSPNTKTLVLPTDQPLSSLMGIAELAGGQLKDGKGGSGSTGGSGPWNS
ncbi:MAG: SPFH domain-containing protein [Alphaproteobacteria bacterium]